MRRVLLARSCAVGREDVVGGVEGVDELGVRVACRGAWSRGDRSKVEVDPRCRGREGGARPSNPKVSRS